MKLDIDLGLFIGWNRMLLSIHRKSDSLFAKYGLTRGQFAVLEALYHKGPLTVGEVQERILTTSGNIPVIVKNLEKCELLSRQQDEQDRRKFILTLTSKGRALIDEVFPQNEEIIKKSFAVWSDEEKIQLRELLQIWRKRDKDEQRN